MCLFWAFSGLGNWLVRYMADLSGKNAVKKVGKVSEKALDGSKREEYLALIDELLELGYNKVANKYTKNRERVAWIRAITGLVNAGSQVLKDQDFDELTKRLGEFGRIG